MTRGDLAALPPGPQLSQIVCEILGIQYRPVSTRESEFLPLCQASDDAGLGWPVVFRDPIYGGMGCTLAYPGDAICEIDLRFTLKSEIALSSLSGPAGASHAACLAVALAEAK